MRQGNGSKSAVEEEQAFFGIHTQKPRHVDVIGESGGQADDSNRFLQHFNLKQGSLIDSVLTRIVTESSLHCPAILRGLLFS